MLLDSIGIFLNKLVGRPGQASYIGHDRSRASWTNQCHWASRLSWSNYRNRISTLKRKHWWGVIILKTLKLLSYEAAVSVFEIPLSALRSSKRFHVNSKPPFNVWLCAPPQVKPFFLVLTTWLSCIPLVSSIEDKWSSHVILTWSKVKFTVSGYVFCE